MLSARRRRRRAEVAVLASWAALVAGCAGHTEGGQAMAPLALYDVVIQQATIVPSRYNVPAGDDVTFFNRSAATVVVMAHDGSFRSPPLEPGAVWLLTKPPAGDHSYRAKGGPPAVGVLDVANRVDRT